VLETARKSRRWVSSLSGMYVATAALIKKSEISVATAPRLQQPPYHDIPLNKGTRIDTESIGHPRGQTHCSVVTLTPTHSPASSSCAAPPQSVAKTPRT
jgi:hypothetical protein